VERCPFCRSDLPDWFYRIAKHPEKFRVYYSEYRRNQNKAYLKYNWAKYVVLQLLNSNDKILNMLDIGLKDCWIDNEDILNILTVLKECLFKMAQDNYCVDDIRYVIHLIDHIWEKGDYHALENFYVDLEEVETIYEEYQEEEPPLKKQVAKKVNKPTSKYTQKHLRRSTRFNGARFNRKV
jgi:hypothetical protein